MKVFNKFVDKVIEHFDLESPRERDDKFRWFWNWFIEQERPFVAVKDRVPDRSREIHAIYIKEKNGLPQTYTGLWDDKYNFSHWRYRNDVDKKQ